MTTIKHDNSRKKLGEIFKKTREAKRLTQQEVADAAEVHVNYYARIERGLENPSFEKLQSIMKVLGIKSLELL
jgi:transcriptional regulator with XRE-family HTH domain